MPKQTSVKVGNHDVRFARRGYPRSTGGCTVFTWAEAHINGAWVSLGDPWQKVRPSNAELLKEIQARTT